MKKNNKGFTLIELLVAIVMMISLTVLVIVGYTRLSDEKKDEADALTEQQIESAAEQYFSSNYYWIEYLKSDLADKKEQDGKTYSVIKVNLAKLIKDDYLNVVSSVKTEEKFSMCDIVEVSYIDKKIKFEYIKDTKNKTSCNPEIKLAGPIDISFEVIGGTIGIPNNKINGTNWYNSDIKLKINFKSNTYDKDYSIDDAIVVNNDYIKNIKIRINGKEESYKYSKKDTKEASKVVTLKDNDKNAVVVEATNYNGDKSSYNIDYFIDKIKPTVNIKAYHSNSNKTTFTDPATIDKSKLLNNDTWTNKNIYAVSIGKDDLSGIYKEGSYCTYNSSATYGNSGSTFDKTTTKYAIGKYGLFVRYTSDIQDTITCRFSDNAGNLSDAATFTVKRDTTPPSLTLNSYKSDKLEDIENHTATSKYDSDTWYSGYADVRVEAKDEESKITLSYKRTNDGNGGSLPKDTSKTSDGPGKLAKYNTYSQAEGTSYYSFVATDEAGNSTSVSHTIKLDRTVPTCKVTANGTLGNIVDGKQWFITDNVTVSISESKDQKHRSGINTNIYGLSQKTDVTYNSKNSVTEEDEGLITWHCYVKDNAGNEGEGEYTFGLEKTVKIEFNAELTNEGTSEGQNLGKKVFNSSLTNKKPVPCGYGNCSNIKCYTDSDKKEKCAKARFARACRYVKSYPRFFKVTAVSEYSTPTLTYATDSDKTNVNIDGVTYYQNKNLTRMEDYPRDNASDEFSKAYYYKEVGNKHGNGTNDFSAHKYQYTSPAGLKSNGIRLYTEYATECY